MAEENRAATLATRTASSASSPQDSSQAFTVLVFSKVGSQGYRHSSIPAGISALKRLSILSKSSPTPFTVHATEDTIVFNPSTLAQYRVIVFLQSSGEFFDNETQLDALKGFVHGGGGIVGIHCASTGLPSSEWYGRLIGGVFTDHPEPQRGIVVVEDPGHPIVAPSLVSEAAGIQFEWFDEWYNFKSNPRVANGVHVLLSVREQSYEGGTMGGDHPIAWCQDFAGARSFYTALGHFDEAYRDTSFTSHILNGILWAGKTRM